MENLFDIVDSATRTKEIFTMLNSASNNAFGTSTDPKIVDGVNISAKLRSAIRKANSKEEIRDILHFASDNSGLDTSTFINNLKTYISKKKRNGKPKRVAEFIGTQLDQIPKGKVPDEVTKKILGKPVVSVPKKESTQQLSSSAPSSSSESGAEREVEIAKKQVVSSNVADIIEKIDKKIGELRGQEARKNYNLVAIKERVKKMLEEQPTTSNDQIVQDIIDDLVPNFQGKLIKGTEKEPMQSEPNVGVPTEVVDTVKEVLVTETDPKEIEKLLKESTETIENQLTTGQQEGKINYRGVEFDFTENISFSLKNYLRNVKKTLSDRQGVDQRKLVDEVNKLNEAMLQEVDEQALGSDAREKIAAPVNLPNPENPPAGLEEETTAVVLETPQSLNPDVQELVQEMDAAQKLETIEEEEEQQLLREAGLPSRAPENPIASSGQDGAPQGLATVTGSDVHKETLRTVLESSGSVVDQEKVDKIIQLMKDGKAKELIDELESITPVEERQRIFDLVRAKLQSEEGSQTSLFTESEETETVSLPSDFFSNIPEADRERIATLVGDAIAQKDIEEMGNVTETDITQEITVEEPEVNEVDDRPTGVSPIRDNVTYEFHKFSLMVFFGTNTNPPWNKELEKTIRDMDIEPSSRAEVMDMIIKASGDLMLVKEKVTEDNKEELLVLIELFFKVNKLSTGPIAGIPLKDLFKLREQIAPPTPLQTTTQPSEQSPFVEATDLQAERAEQQLQRIPLDQGNQGQTGVADPLAEQEGIINKPNSVEAYEKLGLAWYMRKHNMGAYFGNDNPVLEESRMQRYRQKENTTAITNNILPNYNIKVSPSGKTRMQKLKCGKIGKPRY